MKTTKEHDALGINFSGRRYCNQHKKKLSFRECNFCWIGDGKLKPPQGFNHKGCELAHISPSPQGLAYGGYGAVADYEGDKK